MSPTDGGARPYRLTWSTSIRPNDHLERVTESIRRGEIAAAQTAAIAALAAGAETSLLLNLRALDHEAHGRLEAALADLTRAHALAPTDFSILNARGLCLSRMERLEEAIDCFDRALALQPKFAPAWFNRGWNLERLGEPAKAAEAYTKVADLVPDHVQAWANLAWLAARRGDVDAAKRSAGEALSREPGQPTAIMALAEAERDQPEAAERRLRGLLDAANLSQAERALALGILGDALDEQDRCAEAFAAYSQSNAMLKAEAAPRFEALGRRTVADTLGWLTPWTERLDANAWQAGGEPAPRRGSERTHVFLLGFPRSGTTLIETALGAHPDVDALEERNTLDAAVRAFMGAADGLDRLQAASDRELQTYRDDYWGRARSHGVRPEGRIFIDKNPFNTLKLPLIYKLFPNARIIFAVRDPRDVTLSCFRRRFNLNASTYELLDLTRAATFYDGAMRFAELMREKQDMAEHLLFYERLVDDFAGEAKATCDFIGADWRPELTDIAARARRGQVASASSAQIARGIYTDGGDQWRRYERELAPVLPILAPWVSRFGYPPQ